MAGSTGRRLVEEVVAAGDNKWCMACDHAAAGAADTRSNTAVHGAIVANGIRPPHNTPLARIDLESKNIALNTTKKKKDYTPGEE